MPHTHNTKKQVLPLVDHFPVGCSQLPLVGIRHLVNGILQSVEPRHDRDIRAGAVLVPRHTLAYVVPVVPDESKDPEPVFYATRLACTVVNTIVSWGFSQCDKKLKIQCVVATKMSSGKTSLKVW